MLSSILCALQIQKTADNLKRVTAKLEQQNNSLTGDMEMQRTQLNQQLFTAQQEADKVVVAMTVHMLIFVESCCSRYHVGTHQVAIVMHNKCSLCSRSDRLTSYAFASEMHLLQSSWNNLLMHRIVIMLHTCLYLWLLCGSSLLLVMLAKS